MKRGSCQCDTIKPSSACNTTTGSVIVAPLSLRTAHWKHTELLGKTPGSDTWGVTVEQQTKVKMSRTALLSAASLSFRISQNISDFTGEHYVWVSSRPYNRISYWWIYTVDYSNLYYILHNPAMSCRTGASAHFQCSLGEEGADIMPADKLTVRSESCPERSRSSLNRRVDIS
jgi:hypothetical protein